MSERDIVNFVRRSNSSICKSHASFFPTALRAPKVPVFHPVNFTTLLAFTSDFSNNVVTGMCLDSCGRASFPAHFRSRRRGREPAERLNIPVESWVLKRAVSWRSDYTRLRPGTFHHVEMRLRRGWRKSERSWKNIVVFV